MVKIIKDTIHANGIDISIYSEDLQNDYISLTDIAKREKANIQDMLFRTGCAIKYYSVRRSMGIHSQS